MERLPEALPYEGDEQVPLWEGAAGRFGLAPAFARFSWLPRVLPLPEFFVGVRARGEPAAWYYEFDRGDTLYCQAAWVLDPAPEKPLAEGVRVTTSPGEWLFVEETIYMGRDLSLGWRLAPKFEERRWAGSAFQEAMLRIGFAGASWESVEGGRD